jgi:hypothetical protein
LLGLTHYFILRAETTCHSFNRRIIKDQSSKLSLRRLEIGVCVNLTLVVVLLVTKCLAIVVVVAAIVLYAPGYAAFGFALLLLVPVAVLALTTPERHTLRRAFGANVDAVFFAFSIFLVIGLNFAFIDRRREETFSVKCDRSGDSTAIVLRDHPEESITVSSEAVRSACSQGDGSIDLTLELTTTFGCVTSWRVSHIGAPQAPVEELGNVVLYGGRNVFPSRWWCPRR